MNNTTIEKIKSAPSVQRMREIGYCMDQSVSVHILYKKFSTPICITYDWNSELQAYESNPMKKKVVKTRTRPAIAEYLEGLIHDPEVASFNVEWGRWGYQLLGISGWFD